MLKRNRFVELLAKHDIAELSRRTNISRQSLYAYYNGVRPKVDNALIIAKALGLTVEEIFGEVK